MDLVHDRGSMDPVHESGPWTRSKVGVHGPLVHVLSSPLEVRKNTPLRVVFSTLFSVFHLVMKHCISCLIYYVKGFT